MKRRSAFLGALAALIPVGAGRADRPLTEGLHRALLPLYRDLVEGEVGSLAIVGDSVSLLNGSYNWQLRNRLWADFGSAGDGYLAFARFDGPCASHGGGPRCGIQVIRGAGSIVSEDTGPWDELGRPTPDGMWMDLRPTPFPARVTVHAYGRELVLHYTKRVGGGPIEVEVGGQVIGQVETGLASGGPEAGRFVIDTGVDDPDVLSAVRVSTLGAAPAQVNALEMRSATGGLRYHRLARGGAGPARFLASMTPANADVLRSLEPDLLLIMLDASAGDGEDPGTDLYRSNLETLVDWYLAELPGVRLVLMTHHPFTPWIGPQADAMLEVARARGLGYINLYDLFDGYAEMDALGLMSGSVHLSVAGGQWFGSYVHGVLNAAGREALVADFNQDGLFDFFDVQAFLQAFAAGAGDLNGDGASDFFDVQAFLAAFSASTGG